MLLRKMVFLYILFSVLSSSVSAKDKIKFYTSEIIVSPHETAVIPFSLSKRAEENKTLLTTATNVEILKEAQVLKGYDIGFCRIQTQEAGQGILKINNASIKIIVQENDSQTELWLGQPQIQTPISNSFISGEVSVGVLVMNEFRQNPITKDSVRVIDQNGNELKKLGCDNIDEQFVYFHFRLDAKNHTEGALTLTPISTNTWGRQSIGTPTTVWVTHTEKIQKQEAEAQLPVDKRLERWRNKTPTIRSEPTVSNKQYVANPGQRPENVYELDVQETGFYQFFTKVKGQRAAGIYPSIGLYVDLDFDFRTSGRLITNDWHRISLGHPIYLEKGIHQIALAFLNDFYASKTSDRNLYIDYFEWQLIQKNQNQLADLKVAFIENIHQKNIRGAFQLKGKAIWNKKAYQTPPTINLEINGAIVASMVTEDPIFSISRDQLKLGENKLQLSASLPEDSGKVYSVTQIVLCNEIEPKNDPTPTFYSFRVFDSIWQGHLTSQLSTTERYTELALIKKAQTITLNLPETIEGDFSVGIESGGNNQKENTFGVQLTTEGAATSTKNRHRFLIGGANYKELAKVSF